MNDFQERLNDLIKENNLSRLKLAKLIGTTPATLNGYFNNNYYPNIKIAISLASYFNCSLDYLFGLSDNKIGNKTNSDTFVNNLDKIIKENNYSIGQTMRGLKMSRKTYNLWKNGEFPKTSNLIEIAKYFDVSIDYLVGDFNNYK